MRPTRVALVGVLVFSGCLDLSVPAAPTDPFGRLVGALDTQGHGSATGRDVALVSAGGGRFTTQTQADGGFAFEALAPGVYTVVVSLPGFAPPQVPPATVSAGRSTDVGVLLPTWLGQSASEGRLKGKVVVAQGGGSAAGGTVRFTLEGLGEETATAVIAATGEFSARVPPGTYTLEASHPLYVRTQRAGVVVPEGQLVDVSADPLVLGVDPATVEGRVLGEVDQRAASPVEGATISFDTGATVSTDLQGRFRVTGLAPGRRRFTVTKAGFHDDVPSRELDVAPAQTVTVPDLTLALDRGAIVGDVVMADGTPVEDVEVFLPGVTGYVTGASQAATTADGGAAAPGRGSFRIDRVPVGRYDVRARKAGYASASATNVVVTRGSSTAADPMTLVRVQGDFTIDDSDTNNTPGFTRTQSVTLRLTAGTTAAEFRAAESQAALMTAAFATYPGTSIPFMLSAQDGVKTVFLQLKDAVGTLGPALQANIVLDTAAPTPPPAPQRAVLIDGDRGYTNKRAALPISLAAIDTGSGITKYSYSIVSGDGGVPSMPVVRSFATTDQLLLPGLPEGPVALQVRFIDNAGNVSAVATDDVVSDTLPPTGATLTLRAGAPAPVPGFTRTLFNDVDAVFSPEPFGAALYVQQAFSATDVANALLRPAQVADVVTLPSGPDGARTLSYRFVDAAGNVGPVASTSIEYDRTPPALTVTRTTAALTAALAVGVSVSTTSTAEVQHAAALTLSDDPSFAGATAQALPSNGQATFTLGAGDGLRRVFVRLTDRAGNENVQSVSVTVDQSPPLVSSLSLDGQLADGTPSSTLTAQANVTLRFVQLGASGVAYGGASFTCPSTAAGYTTLSAGATSVTSVPLPGTGQTRVMRVCFRDDAGNVAGPLPVSIDYDATPVAGCSLSVTLVRADGTPSPSSTAGQGTLAVTLTCPETPAGAFLGLGPVSCDAVSYAGWPAPSTFTFPGDGAYSVAACVRDAARNVATLTPVAVTVDRTPPTAFDVVLADGGTYLNAAQVTASGRAVAVVGLANGATEWALAESATPTSFVPFTGAASSLTLSAGDGPKTVTVLFRDAARNVSAAVSDTIVVDTAAPVVTGTALAIDAPSTTFLPRRSTSVALTGLPADAVTVRLVEGASSTACAGSDYARATTAVVTGGTLNVPLDLTAGDGVKRVCARLRDAADNETVDLFDTVTLDTTPPTTALFVTPDQILALADDAPVTLTIAADSFDTNFARYELLGGKASTWTPVTVTARTLQGRVVNTGAETGVENVFQLRSVDQAGNLSQVSTVRVTADTNAPEPFNTSQFWVDNGDERSVIYWQPSTSPDVQNMSLSYGSTPLGPFTGVFAQEGASPIERPNTGLSALSGLPNGSPVYARVVPVDPAGNRNAWAQLDGGTQPLLLQPNQVSPTLLSTLPLPTPSGKVHRLARSGTALYVSATTAACGPTTSSPAYVHVVDLQNLPKPIRGGALLPPSTPPLVRTLVLGDAVYCPPPLPPAAGHGFFGDAVRPLDLLVDGHFLFLASAGTVHVFDLSQPLNPLEVLTIPMSLVRPSFFVMGLQLVGDRLVVFGRDTGMASPPGGFSSVAVGVFSLAKLYDENASTRTIQASDVLGTLSWWSAIPLLSGVVTRNRLLLSFGRDTNGVVAPWGSLASVDLTPGLDTSTLTNMVAPSITYSGFTVPVARAALGGNFFYGSNAFDGFRVTDITSAWTSSVTPLTEKAATSSVNSQQFDVVGDQAFVGSEEIGALRVLELGEASAGRLSVSARFGTGTGAQSVLVWGNQAVVALDTSLQFLELATPKSLGFRAEASPAGHHLTLRPGLLQTNSLHYDLTSERRPRLLANAGYQSIGCTVGATWFDESEVNVEWYQLRVQNIATYVDRDGNLTGGTTQVIGLSAPGAERLLDVELWGNWMVLLTMTSTGLNADVYDARKLRDRQGVVLNTGDRRVRLPLLAIADTATRDGMVAELSIAAGRAVVAMDPTVSTAVGPNLVFADLTGAFDDDATTTVTAANVFGPYQAPPARDAVIQHGTAYVATLAGLLAIDVGALMDGSPATSLPSSLVQTTTLSQYDFDGVFVSGSMLLVAPGANGAPGNGVFAFDVSSPRSPTLVGNYPSAPRAFTCPAPFPTRMRNRITAAGSRAYYLSNGTVRVLELE